MCFNKITIVEYYIAYEESRNRDAGIFTDLEEAKAKATEIFNSADYITWVQVRQVDRDFDEDYEFDFELADDEEEENSDDDSDDE